MKKLEFKGVGDVITDKEGDHFVITKTGHSGIPVDMVPVREYVIEQIQDITVTYHGSLSDPLAQGEVITIKELIDRFVSEFLLEKGES